MLLASSLFAQSASPPPGPSITLTVTVTDPSGSYVMGLLPESFRLLNGQPMQPAHLDQIDEPMSIAILVDTSASMQEADMRDIAGPKAIIQAVKHVLELSNPQNEFFLMTFDKTMQLRVDWRKGKDLPEFEIAPPLDKHVTTLYDACFAALDKLKAAHYDKRAIVLFSDGMDGGSKTQLPDLRRELEGTDVLLYVVAPRLHYMVASDIKSILRDAVNRDTQKILTDIVQITGGVVYFPESGRELTEAAERIAVEMRNQYRLTFRLASGDGKGGTSHRVKLEVTPPTNVPTKLQKLRVRTRRNFLTP